MTHPCDHEPSHTPPESIPNTIASQFALIDTFEASWPHSAHCWVPQSMLKTTESSFAMLQESTNPTRGFSNSEAVQLQRLQKQVRVTRSRRAALPFRVQGSDRAAGREIRWVWSGTWATIWMRRWRSDWRGRESMGAGPDSSSSPRPRLPRSPRCDNAPRPLPLPMPLLHLFIFKLMNDDFLWMNDGLWRVTLMDVSWMTEKYEVGTTGGWRGGLHP